MVDLHYPIVLHRVRRGLPKRWPRRLRARDPRDLTYLLRKQNVPWGHDVFDGTEPDCANGSDVACAPVAPGPKTPDIWNPLPYFDTVKQGGQLANIQSLTHFHAAAKDGTLRPPAGSTRPVQSASILPRWSAPASPTCRV